MSIVWTADPLPRSTRSTLQPSVPAPSVRRTPATSSFEHVDTFGRTSADVDAAYADVDAARHTSASAQRATHRALCVDAFNRYLQRATWRADR